MQYSADECASQRSTDRRTDGRTDSDGATRRCPRARCSGSSRLDGRTRWRAVMRRIASRDQTCSSSSSSRGSKHCCTHSVVSIIHPRQRQHYPHTHTHTHSIVSCYRRVIDAPRPVREAGSLCNGRASIRLSVCLSASSMPAATATGGFAAERRRLH